MSEPEVIQYVADLPDFPGAQALFRSFDSGQTWEVCTRTLEWGTWSGPRTAVTA